MVVEDSDGDGLAGEGSRRCIGDARRLLRDDSPSIERVDELLEEAERSLSSSECRLDRPYANIVQVGDASGIHYECTHHPSHRFTA